MTYILLTLATWRLASLLVNEEGPFHIFEKLRWWAGIRKEEIRDGFLAGVFSCVWCCSLWVGGAWTLAWILFPGAVEWLALPFALSAAAIWMERMVGNGR